MTWSWPIPSERPLVAPSLLAADFARLGEEASAVEEAGADLLHLDVMDGNFVPALTIGPLVIAAVRRATGLFLDTHLMIREPIRSLADYRAAGSDGITVHAEACSDLGATLAAVRSTGARVGLALDPSTPLEPYRRHLPEIDLLLLMTVVAGRGGQAFLPEVLPKVEEAARIRSRERLGFAIEVDGGIGPGTAGAVRRAGADILVAGTAVFRHPPYGGALAALRDAAP